MEAPAPHFERFLHALHRRLVVVRAMEWLGLGALLGCAAAAVLIPLLLWRGESALTPALFLLGLGAAAGLLWGLTHRPTALAAALEADRQLGLADLLGTAAACAAAGNDPWSRTVLAVADDRCRRHAPSQVLLNRLGGRAWGGIGLAAALVLTLAALTPGTSPLHATVTAGGGLSRAPQRHSEIADGGAPRAAARPAAPHSADPVSRQAQTIGGEEVSRTADAAARDHEHEKMSTSAESGRPNGAGDDGRGAGTGRARDAVASRDPAASRDPVASRGPAHPATALPAAATSTSTARGAAGNGSSAGATQSTPSGRDTDDRSASTPAPDPHPHPTPPWRSASWPADVRAARDAVDAGGVPDSARDLVREYFDRP